MPIRRAGIMRWIWGTMSRAEVTTGTETAAASRSCSRTMRPLQFSVSTEIPSFSSARAASR